MRCTLAFCVSLFVSFGAPTWALANTTSTERQPTSAESGWIQLFDGNSLRGWFPKIQNQKRGEDKGKFFQVHDGVIHVYKDQAPDSSVTIGVLMTDAEYAYYHLRMEYKWGDKRFKPRAMGKRDAGLLYHVVTPDLVWPRCIECQIQESDTGDCFTVRGTQVVASVEMMEIETPMGKKKMSGYKPEEDGGVPRTIGDGGISRVIKSSTYEHDGWNTVEVIVRGSEGSEHIVNGLTVFKATNLKQLGPAAEVSEKATKDAAQKDWEPLAAGRIALQCEFAEVFYRNIEIRPIRGGPMEAKTK
jgi:3-keto-disaccharide hydrolase